jgi:hypothetical protein
MNDDELSPERAELLTLRARVVVAERAALAALEAMLLIRPEQLTLILESTRKGLAVARDSRSADARANVEHLHFGPDGRSAAIA